MSKIWGPVHRFGEDETRPEMPATHGDHGGGSTHSPAPHREPFVMPGIITKPHGHVYPRAFDSDDDGL